MTGQKCINCNAVLPLDAPGTVVVCPFCGAQNRMAGAVPPPPVLPPVLPPIGGRKAETTTTGRVILLVVVLSIFGTVGFIIWSVMRTVSEVSTATRTVTSSSTTVTVTRPGGVTVLPGGQVPTNELFELTPEGNVLLKIPGVEVAPGPGTGSTTLVPPRPTPPAERLVPPAELTTIAKGRWVKLDPAGLPGGFATFDPTAAVPWILAAARHWSTDARFERIVADGVRADGTADLTAGEFSVEYRLYSPALRESATKAAAVSTAAAAPTELRLNLRQGRLEAMFDIYGGQGFESPDGFEVQCAMPKVLELLRGHGLSQLPTYELTMSCSGGARCKWSVSPPHDGPALAAWNAGVPEIPADDCSTFPTTPGRRGR